MLVHPARGPGGAHQTPKLSHTGARSSCVWVLPSATWTGFCTATVFGATRQSPRNAFKPSSSLPTKGFVARAEAGIQLCCEGSFARLLGAVAAETCDVKDSLKKESRSMRSADLASGAAFASQRTRIAKGFVGAGCATCSGSMVAPGALVPATNALSTAGGTFGAHWRSSYFLLQSSTRCSLVASAGGLDSGLEPPYKASAWALPIAFMRAISSGPQR
mmetsp:Transcript_63637/g.163803  ORF Transcript_63637/g.163803 Transcript_63637/m.163803 type:complete len:218 (+) Transcript_63637:164-817(+)